MGVSFTDKFSLLHFASGIIAYYWNLSFFDWFILHLVYEIIQNSKYGILFINNVVTLWPGGKLSYDSYTNMVGDQFYGILGWIFTHFFLYFFYGGLGLDTFVTRNG
jgi:hypothetical protein